MFKGRLGIWIFVLLIAFGGPFLHENIPVWLHTDDVVVASELTHVDLLDAMSQEKFGHFKVQTTTENPDVIFTLDNQEREGYKLVENAVFSPMTLYFTYAASDNEEGFIQDDSNDYMLKMNLNTILLAMEDNSTWQDIGVNKKVVEGKVTLHIPDKHDWTYSTVEELFYFTLNGGNTPDEEQRAALKERVDALLSKCVKCASVAQTLADEAENPTDGKKVFLAPEYLYLTCPGMGNNNYSQFIPVAITKTISVYANAYLKTGYEDLNLSEGLFTAMQSGKGFMSVTGWRVKDAKFDITKFWSRLPNVV